MAGKKKGKRGGGRGGGGGSSSRRNKPTASPNSSNNTTSPAPAVGMSNGEVFSFTSGGSSTASSSPSSLSGTSSPPVSPSSPFDAAAMCEKASSLVDTFQFDLAAKFYEKALNLEPQNTDVMFLLASADLELGRLHQAQQLLARAIELSPNKGAQKFMLFGQFVSCEESLKYYEKGLEIMRNELSGCSEVARRQVLKKEISTGLVTMAEVYLTDLCFDPNAETKCGEYLTEALQVDDTNPETYQTMASFCISSQNLPKARECLQKSLNLWATSMDSIPSYEFRVTTGKLLLELEQPTEAATVLELLILEDDSDVEVLYLLALAQRGNNSLERALDCCQAIVAKLDKEKESGGGSDRPEEEVQFEATVRQLENEVAAQIEADGDYDDGDMDDGDDDDDDDDEDDGGGNDEMRL
eukprot:TRINITY_DN425_c2_g1_i1.p1 TRINITY_DN425_c2_g1~~TRINITY_DN425_c2_g1_i1.p1  ORF type:complete len:412 (-),score=138.88 TRINITY_DN425_c2_g1_i1:1729-2964(-)